MITIEEIIKSNLEMLKTQEAQLVKSLDFVRKAAQLFESQNGSSSTKTIRRRRRRGKVAKVTTTTATTSKTSTRRRRRTGKASAKPATPRVSGKRMKHIDNIINILRQKNSPLSSGEVIQTMFKSQSADKNLKHFRLLIYPVLTKAYKSGTLKLKDGKIHLPA